MRIFQGTMGRVRDNKAATDPVERPYAGDIVWAQDSKVERRKPMAHDRTNRLARKPPLFFGDFSFRVAEADRMTEFMGESFRHIGREPHSACRYAPVLCHVRIEEYPGPPFPLSASLVRSVMSKAPT